jgi:CheY-like chemotaxis protein
MRNDARPVVLLVQPERDDREMYAEFLRHAGLTPMVVSGATSALTLALDADVIVTGVILSGQMDGIEFMEHLKKDDATKNIPIVVLTSAAWDTERERAEQAGCDVFLAKPCLPGTLLREVRRMLTSSVVRTKEGKPAKASLQNDPHVGRKPKRTA